MRARNPLAVIAPALAVTSLIIALTGCAGNGSQADPESSAPSESPSTSQPPSDDSGDSEDSDDSGETPEPSPVEGQCADDALEVAVEPDAGGNGAGSLGYRVTFTNIGTAECVLSGYPGVSVVGNGDGTQVGVPADRADASAEPVSIAPGDAAVALLQAVNVGEGGGPLGCETAAGDGWRVYPPGSTKAFFASDDTVFACTDDQVFLHLTGPVAAL